ncbi:MAG: hypothetical protein B6D56_06680 [Candidatus Omnitrophica bacterium 4484_70.1]|nr:MAG: hypothetical protein B6D56_06680 [Candidatus Omnitrophica bacterium 4484_70.1]
MRKKYLFFLLIAFSISSLKAQNIKVATIEDYIIGPPTYSYIKRVLNLAEKEKAILLLRLDTPGGLLNSTQKIVKLFLNSSVPIIVYISPQGARAASAGVFISYASHILAMAPSTHIGSAHPVLGGGSWGKLDEKVKEKVMKDTLAWARSIAEERKRPPRFIRQAIEESLSLTEKEALKEKICDLVADSLDELLEKVNGRKVKIKNRLVSLSTKNSSVEFVDFTFSEKFLNALINPNIAYLLLTLGFFGLIFEVTHPGFGFPGIAGIICLILAFYALSILPVNYAGVVLIVLGIVFFVVEAFTPTFGMFTLAGLVCLFLGTIMMFNQPQLVKVSYKYFLPVIAFFAFLSLFLLGKIIAAQRRKPFTGSEGLIGKEAEALTDIEKQGKVMVASEIWNATSLEKINKGEKVVIEKVEGLRLWVRKKESTI